VAVGVDGASFADGGERALQRVLVLDE